MDAHRDKTIIHYNEMRRNRPVTLSRDAWSFSDELKRLPNRVCLINTCYEHTGFEPVPAAVDGWLDEIGLDYGNFPGLYRIWGMNESEYAFRLGYEIANEFSDDSELDDKQPAPYNTQLGELKEAALKLSMAIPYAHVRLTELSGCSNTHEIEVFFIYPATTPEMIIDACRVISKDFDYVWDLGTISDKR